MDHVHDKEHRLWPKQIVHSHCHLFDTAYISAYSKENEESLVCTRLAIVFFIEGDNERCKL